MADVISAVNVTGEKCSRLFADEGTAAVTVDVGVADILQLNPRFPMYLSEINFTNI